MREIDRRRCFIALIVAFAIGFELLLILVDGYLIWSILSMYFRMKSLG